MLLDFGADVNVVTMNEGVNAFYLAVAESGDVNLGEFLRGRGVDVCNVMRSRGGLSGGRPGYTVLHRACERGDLRVVKYLLDCVLELDVNARDWEEGLTALDVAVCEQERKGLGSISVSGGGNGNTCGIGGVVLLMLACPRVDVSGLDLRRVGVSDGEVGKVVEVRNVLANAMHERFQNNGGFGGGSRFGGSVG
ncbi:hypothetical protein HDU76_010686 [Blyttiomyces sp. JEL0837]|nr:hypothetical protein HDU76_010686 [Blyttiomyces sp. JEL0837]